MTTSQSWHRNGCRVTKMGVLVIGLFLDLLDMEAIISVTMVRAGGWNMVIVFQTGRNETKRDETR